MAPHVAFHWVAPLFVVGVLACERSADGAVEDAGTPRSDALITDYAAAAITLPPESLGLDAAFYKKYTDAGGIPIISSAKVPDDALLVARDIVNPGPESPRANGDRSMWCGRIPPRWAPSPRHR